MEINFEDYISDEEKKEIVVEEYRSLVRAKMKTEYDLKRILSNIAYDVYYDIVDECFDGTSKKLLKDNIDKIIADPSSYNIFKKPNAWDRDANSAYKYLQEVIVANKPKIAKIVSDLLEEQTIKACKEDMTKTIHDVLAGYIRKI